jgi:hypothetical protein
MEANTYAQPWGVTTPKGQSPESFSTIWSKNTGVTTMPALTRDAAAERSVTKIVVFIVMRLITQWRDIEAVLKRQRETDRLVNMWGIERKTLEVTEPAETQEKKS